MFKSARPLSFVRCQNHQKIVSNVKILRLACFNGSKGAFVKANRTKDKFHDGINLLAVGLSQYKLAISLFRFRLFVTSWLKCPK